MNAEDEKMISEQLQLIGSKQAVLQHTIKTQLQVVNATIAHVDDVENILERNENKLREAVEKITQKVDDYAQQQELRDYFLELGSLLSEMELDAEGIIEYVTDVHTKFAKLEVVPLEQIIHSLKEANNQFMRDLRFPFAVILENWLESKRFVTVSVYCKDSNIFTVVKFPLINSGSYNVYRVIPLPVHERDNVFAAVRVKHPVVAIDTNRQTYFILSETQWNNCISVQDHYVCKNVDSMYRFSQGTPCELQMFVNEDGKYEDCEIDHMVSNQTIWVRLTKARVWLFSILKKETLRVTCENKSERIEVISGVREIELPEQCELTTASIIVRTNQVVKGVGINTFLPRFNITAPRKREHVNNNGMELEDVTRNKVQLRRNLRKKMILLITRFISSRTLFFRLW
ncbi:uncharacterized protein LOC109861140 [Pseudomyrmex gracilis]|uniref:uncharacterized protein LOC109861140 n=1 Tax=Pseudomyrmex gracilis TaxID=219809 RepID=UPI000995130D|nr:uncharacterized protein LOC109861140 [Pseudomyrmex gracilis]